MHVDRTAQVSHSPAALRRGGLCGKRLKGSKDVQVLVSRKWGFTDVGILMWRDPPGLCGGIPPRLCSGIPPRLCDRIPLGGPVAPAESHRSRKGGEFPDHDQAEH